MISHMGNITYNSKGADAFKSTTNPILDLFTETRKVFPETLEEFKLLVRKIENAKNFDSEMFVRLLKLHRLIEKGNGLKGIYYISMIILKEEDPITYKQILDWSYQYPKDILRLARLSSMYGQGMSTSGVTIELANDPTPKDACASVSKVRKNKKKQLGKKNIKWTLTEMQNKNLVVTESVQTVTLAIELDLYAKLLADVIKKILTGKMYDDDVNLTLFKYLSYETGHFALESALIWKRTQDILSDDVVVKASLDALKI